MKTTCLRLGAAVSLWLAACSGRAPNPAPQPPAARAASLPVARSLTGSARCATCHAAEAQAWQRSHHAQATQPAIPEHVLANDGAPTGARFTLGVYPLQQYLVPGARGRLDVHALAWDARPAVLGGQRWFTPSGSVTGPPQHWNGACAACHSTGLREGYDSARDSFDTTWSELNVGCEACHGPGSRHVSWAEAGKPSGLAHAGFDPPLRAASATRWTFESDRVIASPSPRHIASTSDREAETNRCVACHARRVEIAREPHLTTRLLDVYAPNLIEAGLYEVDGQLADENFEFGSFAQSRMYLAGVTCSNCHEPHTAQLRAPGDALCAQCHRADHYAEASHHHHRAGSDGAACVNCHMPRKTFMGVHVRRDHFIRAPRPDLSARFGTADACSQCHADRAAGWTARALERWGVQPSGPAARVAAALDAGRHKRVGANDLLAEVASDARVPAIQRASAVALLRGPLAPAARAAFELVARDSDDLLQLGAARALDALEDRERLELGVPLLAHAARAVRIEAARALADLPAEQLGERASVRRDDALREWLDARELDADRADTHVAIAQVHARRGAAADAERELRRALTLDPQSLAARINFADLQRALGRDAEAERLLRETVQRAPEAAIAWHALGLALIRLGRTAEAVEPLAKAAQLAPDERDYADAYALALREARAGTR